MDKIMIDFGDVVEEMKNKKVKLCLLHKRADWFLIDSQNQLYQIESYYCGGYLDRYIKEKIKIEFNIVPISSSNTIEDWEIEMWDVEKVEDFIKRQSKYWF